MTTTSASNDTLEQDTPQSKLEAARDKVVDAAGAAKSASVESLAAARDKLVDAAGAAKTAGAESISVAREKLEGGYASARDKATTAFADAKEKATSAYETARAKGTEAARKASDGIDDNPVAALVGGLALGALAAAILPRTERETAALGAIGGKVTSAARDAATAARDAAKTAGKEKLEELGLNKDNARDTVSRIVGEVATAVTSAGTAAVNAGTSPDKPGKDQA